MNKENIHKSIEAIAQAKVALEGAEDVGAAAWAAQIEAIQSGLENLTHSPPSMRTSEFDNQGEYVPIPSISSGPALERIIDESDLLPIMFLEQGARIQRSVARIVLKQSHGGLPAGSGWGTGFLVSPDLLLTNNHVIPDTSTALKVHIQFNYQLSPNGIQNQTQYFSTAADNLLHTNKSLDYTLLRVNPGPIPSDGAATSGMAPPGQHWGFIPINQTPNFRAQQHFNIIQHPAGRHKEVALQDNEIDELFENAVRYKGDTEGGSSGSPVFDNLWQLVALHHSAGQRVDGKWVNNEGIRIDRIAQDLISALTDSNPSIISELGLVPT